MCNDGSGSRLGSYDTSTYPGSGPSTPKVKPLLHALLFIIYTWWLTRLLEVYCIEVEEEEFDLSILRVQAPFYRQGPGYSLVSGCPAAGSPVAVVLAWAPPSSGPLPGRRPLYIAPFTLGQAYSEHMPLVCLGSFRGGGSCPLWLVEAECGWRHAGLQPLSILLGPCCL
jgi:hypothetical protein